MNYLRVVNSLEYTYCERKFDSSGANETCLWLADSAVKTGRLVTRTDVIISDHAS